MKYKNAEEILPLELLKQIQTYVCGEYLYIPICGNKRAWGEKSGSKNELKERNFLIKEKYKNGYSVLELAQEYFLSESSIRKIIKHKY